VQTTLIRVGTTPGGALAVPAGSHYDQAAWYRYSPTPGSLGPAVIVGHIDSTKGASVFFRLGSLGPGDLVRVTRTDQSVAEFAVDDVARYRKDHFPTKRVYGNTDHAALRLISCGGPFDRSSGHYRDNIIVTASLINS
jgi:sortase (surface protein transpeptidase)